MTYQYNPPPGVHWFRDQPRLMYSSDYPTKQGWVDLRGKTLIRSTVIGLPWDQPDDYEGSKGRLWVLRCCCGNYFLMRSSYIKQRLKSHSPVDCHYCRHLRAIAKDHLENRVG